MLSLCRVGTIHTKVGVKYMNEYLYVAVFEKKICFEFVFWISKQSICICIQILISTCISMLWINKAHVRSVGHSYQIQLETGAYSSTIQRELLKDTI